MNGYTQRELRENLSEIRNLLKRCEWLSQYTNKDFFTELFKDRNGIYVYVHLYVCMYVCIFTFTET